MRLPVIADRLRELADEKDLPELRELADEIRRRPTGPYAPRQSQKMTPELAKDIRTMARTYPDMSQAAIAQLFSVNPGRVSEALRGKRQ
jgi:hypothetical protein